MVLRKLERRNYGRKSPLSIYQNLHSFKEGLILWCQSIHETRRITHLHGSAHFRIPLKVNHCLHLNIFSPSKIFDNFCMLLKEISMNFDIIVLTESTIKKNSVSPINIELESCSTEHTPTKISTGGALLYINKRLSYHPRNYLNIYTPGKLESIFIELVCPKSSNIIVGCTYKHPSLQVNNFANIILSLLEKLNKENSKKNFLHGDFNIDLLQYETSEPCNNFVDTLSSNFLSPLILLPTRISNSSSPLINNIFCNVTFNSNIISGNFT